MIGTTLQLITQGLNEYTCKELGINLFTKKVMLSPIVDPNGALVVPDHNVLLLKLINIETDPLANNYMPTASDFGRNALVGAQPRYIKLSVILAAYFQPEKTQAGLDTLTMGMTFFQNKPLWNHENTPGLPSNIDRMIFEEESLDYQQLNQVWGAIGASYLPSIMYKIRMIMVNDSTGEEAIPSVSAISTSPDKS